MYPYEALELLVVLMPLIVSSKRPRVVKGEHFIVTPYPPTTIPDLPPRLRVAGTVLLPPTATPWAWIDFRAVRRTKAPLSQLSRVSESGATTLIPRDTDLVAYGSLFQLIAPGMDTSSNVAIEKRARSWRGDLDSKKLLFRLAYLIRLTDCFETIIAAMFDIQGCLKNKQYFTDLNKTELGVTNHWVGLTSMFFDEDGDLAHEFFVEVPPTRRGCKATMKKVLDNLTPQEK
uniref:Uncharacterized protein n=1 Tax=Timema monikensis TaxID=170555 RepID=A0A7R9HSJ4_9NEOP|nr:unnamed protein product [Timema monikensis]